MGADAPPCFVLLSCLLLPLSASFFPLRPSCVRSPPFLAPRRHDNLLNKDIPELQRRIEALEEQLKAQQQSLADTVDSLGGAEAELAVSECVGMRAVTGAIQTCVPPLPIALRLISYASTGHASGPAPALPTAPHG